MFFYKCNYTRRSTMAPNKNVLQGKWNEIKGKIKQQWGELTDDEITKINGSFDELSGTIQKRYGYNEERTKRDINDFLKKHNLSD